MPEATEKDHRKPCDICKLPKDVLVRCQTDETETWKFVCPGKCWKTVSGGDIDGDKTHPHYRYGGMWKNKHEAVSAKRKTPKNQKKVHEWRPLVDDQDGYRWTKNDRAIFEGQTYVCRKSHVQDSEPTPSEKFWSAITEVRPVDGSSANENIDEKHTASVFDGSADELGS